MRPRPTRTVRDIRPEPRPFKLAPTDIREHAGTDAVWASVLERLAIYGVQEAAIENWLRPARPLGEYRGSLAIEADRTVADWLRRRYASIVGEILRDAGTFDGLRVYDRPPEADR